MRETIASRHPGQGAATRAPRPVGARAALSLWVRLAGGGCVLWGAVCFLRHLGLPGPDADGAAVLPAALGGCALWLRQSEGSRWRRWAAAAASLAVAWCGAQSLGAVFGRDLSGPLAWAGVASYGGAGLSGALSVGLFGCALLMLALPVGNQAAQFLTLTGMIVAGLAALRGMPGLDALGAQASMLTLPPNSSLPLLVLGAGLFAEQQRRVLDWHDADRARLRQEVEKASAEEMVRISSQFKSEFLVNMSHELRTPLNGVLGMSEALLDTDLDDKQRDFVETARQSALNLLNTLQSIMTFWEGQSGTLTFEPGDLDVREVVSAAVRAAAPATQKKGLEIAYMIGEDCPPMVRGDRQLVLGVLLHLISNAIKFTDSGEITVQVSKSSQKEDCVTLVFAVSDSGTGVSPEAEAHLFQPFSHGAGVTTRKYGGAGLGLPVAKRMVETMNGSIGYRSTPGEGATFWFSTVFPVLSGAKRAATGLENRRALVVGDHATRQSLLHLQLVTFGMSTDCAAGPAQALVSLSDAANRGRPFGVVFLNDELPVHECVELIRKTRSYPFLARTKIFMLRGNKDASDEAIPGIDAVLSKPLKPDEFEEKLRALMAPAAKPNVRARARILIAEDDKVNEKVALLMLKKMGVRADVAPDGVEAVRRYKDGRYDLILMDCNMPEMDGYTATAEIRRLEGAGPRIPIIALTANALKRDRKRCLDAGMDGYLSKPVNPHELLATLTRWLKSDALGGGAAVAVPGAVPQASSRVAAAAPPAFAAPTGDIDEKVLADLKEMGGGDELVKDIVKSYLDDEAPACMRLIESAVMGGLCEDLRKAAHKLKGSSRAVGARLVAEACLHLEEMGRAGQAAEAPVVFGELVCRYDSAHEALRQRIA